MDHDSRHTKIEKLQWEIAAATLQRGLDVILDFGLWTKQERDKFRRRATTLGAKTKIHFLDVPFEELIERLEVRNSGHHEEVTFIPLSKMREYRPQFQAPDESELTYGTD